jgi:hypothetical protein
MCIVCRFASVLGSLLHAEFCVLQQVHCCCLWVCWILNLMCDLDLFLLTCMCGLLVADGSHPLEGMSVDISMHAIEQVCSVLMHLQQSDQALVPPTHHCDVVRALQAHCPAAPMQLHAGRSRTAARTAAQPCAGPASCSRGHWQHMQCQHKKP